MVGSLTLGISRVSFFFDIVAVLLANCVGYGRENKHVSVTYGGETVTVANRAGNVTDSALLLVYTRSAHFARFMPPSKQRKLPEHTLLNLCFLKVYQHKHHSSALHDFLPGLLLPLPWKCQNKRDLMDRLRTNKHIKQCCGKRALT